MSHKRILIIISLKILIIGAGKPRHLRCRCVCAFKGNGNMRKSLCNHGQRLKHFTAAESPQRVDGACRRARPKPAAVHGASLSPREMRTKYSTLISNHDIDDHPTQYLYYVINHVINTIIHNHPTQYALSTIPYFNSYTQPPYLMRTQYHTLLTLLYTTILPKAYCFPPNITDIK